MKTRVSLKYFVRYCRLKYNKQRNLCVSSLGKPKRNYYKNLDLNDLNDNKKFWTTMKPPFASRYNQWKTDLNGKLIRDEKEVANIFNDFFVKYSPEFRDKYRT